MHPVVRRIGQQILNRANFTQEITIDPMPPVYRPVGVSGGLWPTHYNFPFFRHSIGCYGRP